MAASIWNSVAPESMFPLTMYAIDWENQRTSGSFWHETENQGNVVILENPAV